MKTILIGIMVAFALSAQQQAGKVEFEVVSVKPANPDLSSGGAAHMVGGTPGRWEARNLPLRDLVRTAWHLNENQLVGGPSWLGTAGWDVDARYPAGTSPAQISQMLQAMLADRFQILVHRETRTLPVYTLTVAKGGTKLRESTEDDRMSAGLRFIRYTSATIGDLSRQLSSYLERQVIDQTGLTGHYVINLSFAPVDPGDTSGGDAATDSAPSIFKAVQDQLGLKLDSTRGPVDVLVIDRAEKPSPN